MDIRKVPKPKTHPETEVFPTRQNDRPQRRRFSADEKARIRAEADACTERGQLGTLLHREDLQLAPDELASATQA